MHRSIAVEATRNHSTEAGLESHIDERKSTPPAHAVDIPDGRSFRIQCELWFFPPQGPQIRYQYYLLRFFAGNRYRYVMECEEELGQNLDMEPTGNTLQRKTPLHTGRCSQVGVQNSRRRANWRKREGVPDASPAKRDDTESPGLLPKVAREGFPHSPTKSRGAQ